MTDVAKLVDELRLDEKAALTAGTGMCARSPSPASASRRSG